jgi:hypothetical protein
MPMYMCVCCSGVGGEHVIYVVNVMKELKLTCQHH